jgi:hypothetical protein
MNGEIQKAAAFIGRLLQNPALSGLTPLQKEEQILQFLTQNGPQLYPTLTSGNFFPGKNWEQIYNLLVQAVVGEINKGFLPNLKTIIYDKIQLSFVPFLRQQNIPYQTIKQELFSFYSNFMQKPEARRGFTGAFSALVFNYTERYLNEIYARKEYIHFELIKVQRLKLPKEEMRHFLNMSILLRPLIHMLTAGTGNAHGSGISIVQSQFADKVFLIAKNQLKYLPDQVLRSGINSNVSFLENRNLQVTSRITALYSTRCRNYNPNVKVDRGADSADKSWFSIARRNFKFYGYDVKMLDEFYKIAAENGW